MGLTVNTNIAGLSAQRNLNINNDRLGNSITRLSSGLRINSAADDAAGLSIATKFAAQVRGLSQAVRNSNNAISLVQVAEGGIDTITNILQRLRELAVQAASDDNTKSDRATITKEANNLTEELTRVANTSEFNTQTLLDGSFRDKLFQIGANADQTLNINIRDIRGTAIGGRAEFTSSIDDGVGTAIDEGFGAGEIKINGTDVAATTSADDQFSVLTLATAQIGSTASAATVQFNVNGNAVAVAVGANQAGSEVAASLAAAINAAGITGVTARVVDGSGVAIDGANGTNLNLAVSNTGGGNSTETRTLIGFAGAASNNVAFGSAGNAVANANGESSSIAKAVAINSVKTTTTVSATAVKNVVTGTSAVSAATFNSGDLFVNGVDIGAVTTLASDSNGALVTAINNKSNETGVTASVNADGKLQLSASDGRNISIQTSSATLATSAGLGLDGTSQSNTSLVFRGQVRLNSQETFTLSSANSLEDLDNGLGTSKSVAKDVATYNINNVKVDTQENATAAILTLDAALNDVSDLRSDLGAIQNRIEFTISNLDVAGENTSASESRIRDADFATEVAKFTKNQILVQAGTAMLAQANGLPQIALQLLG